jgi:predicted dehydrogenase
MSIRVAIVGAGIGAQHVDGFLANPEAFRVAVICDRDLARGGELAARIAAAGQPLPALVAE